jgi:hypothetical protein
MRSTVDASKGRPAMCKLIGRPLGVNPQQTDIAGMPVKLNTRDPLVRRTGHAASSDMGLRVDHRHDGLLLLLDL